MIDYDDEPDDRAEAYRFDLGKRDAKEEPAVHSLPEMRRSRVDGLFYQFTMCGLPYEPGLTRIPNPGGYSDATGEYVPMGRVTCRDCLAAARRHAELCDLGRRHR